MKIFIIDDDQLSSFLTQYTLLLEDTQLSISIFFSGTEALEVLQTSEEELLPDIIFLDLNMPIMDGWEFLDALGAYAPAIRGRCRIYILTSSLDTTDTERAKEYAIVSGLIHKPLKSEDMALIFAWFQESKKMTAKFKN
jgi:CheY-like chemotaxis protein